MSGIAAGHCAVVDIIGAVALATEELLAVLLPGEGIVGAAVVGETVGALSVVGDKSHVVAAGAHDDAVIGAEDTGGLRLALGVDADILGTAVVVARGMEMAHTLLKAGLDLTEMAVVAEDARELAGQWMKGGVEGETTAVVAVDALVGSAGGEY